MMKEFISMPTIQSLGLNGKVKSYALFNDTEYKDTEEKEHFFVCGVNFNSDGNIVKTYSSEDTLNSAYCLYKYDDKGNLVEMSKYTVDDLLKNKVLFHYTENGDLTLVERQDFDWYGTGKMKTRQISLYDKNGMESRFEYIYYNKEGDLSHRDVYKYGKSNMAELSSYNGKGDLLSKKKCKAESITVERDPGFFVLGKNVGFDIAEYDEAGNVIGRVRYYLDRTVKYICQIEYFQ